MSLALFLKKEKNDIHYLFELAWDLPPFPSSEPNESMSRKTDKCRVSKADGLKTTLQTCFK